MIGVLIGGLFIVVFGGMLLILVLGAGQVEDEVKAREAEAREMRAEPTRPARFLEAAPPPRPQTGQPQLDEALLSQLQQYIDAEQTLADEFVLQPSIDSLYRETGRKLAAR